MNPPSVVPLVAHVPAPSPVRRHRFLLSFRVQVAAALAAIAVVLAITLSWVLGSMLADRSERHEGVALRTAATHAAIVFAEGMRSRSREVESMAASPLLWSDGLDSERVKQAISRIQAVNAYSAWIGVADTEGIVRSSSGNLLKGASVKERPWFQQGLQSLYVGDVHPAKLLAKLLPPSSDGEPQRFVDFSAPIKIDGRVVGVLGLHGSWDWAQAVTESLLPADAVVRKIEIFVFDRNGAVISAPNRTLEAQRSAGQKSPVAASALNEGASPQQAPLVRWADGAEYLTTAAPVQAKSKATDLGWTVVAREPSGSALAVAREGERQALWLGLIAAALMSLFGWFVADRLTRPLRRMAAAAKAFEDGAAAVDLPHSASSREMVQLSQALAGMTRKLVDANLELERRVAQRTSELQAANADLDWQARHDSLTGLLNRRGFEDRVGQLVALARRQGTPISVLVFDVDHFKRVNDAHGHDTGDRVLATVARLLMVRLRETDLLARFGGEEFVALLPDADADQAKVVAEQVVELIASLPIDDVGQVTISCGVAEIREESEGLRGAMRRADEALYRAKNDGRNRAKFADTTIELSHLH